MLRQEEYDGPAMGQVDAAVSLLTSVHITSCHAAHGVQQPMGASETCNTWHRSLWVDCSHTRRWFGYMQGELTDISDKCEKGSH